MSLYSLKKEIYKKIIARSQPPTKPTLDEKVANKGERLVPDLYLTLNPDELIRHQSSYEFFLKIIKKDLEYLKKFKKEKTIKILDLGCGTGHGCETLSKIPKTHITGVEISSDAIEYAKKKYRRPNITYQQADIAKYIPSMPEFDYIVSRGVIEHIRNGLKLIKLSRWRYRLIFDVPYDEARGVNQYHVLTKITEKDFKKFSNRELFYEDLGGIIYDVQHKPPKPNMIMCVASHRRLSKIKNLKIKFPISAWKLPKDIQIK